MKYFLSLLLITSTALAAPSKASKKGKNTRSYHWYDGKTKRKVWMNDKLVSEFGTDEVRRNFSDAKPVQGRFGNARIYRLENYTSEHVSRSMHSRSNAVNVSPIFHDVNSPTAAMRALPGNVIVVLKKNRSEEEATAWLKGRNLQVLEKLPFSKNAFLVKSESGLSTLQLANELYETGELEISQPDWWTEGEAK